MVNLLGQPANQPAIAGQPAGHRWLISRHQLAGWTRKHAKCLWKSAISYFQHVNRCWAQCLFLLFLFRFGFQCRNTESHDNQHSFPFGASWAFENFNFVMVSGRKTSTWSFAETKCCSIFSGFKFSLQLLCICMPCQTQPSFAAKQIHSCLCGLEKDMS